MSQLIGETLTDKQKELFNQVNFTGIVATVSEAGIPNTAPMALFYAPLRDKILMAVSTQHDTFINIKANNKVMISGLASGDHAFSVTGTGEVVKERMDAFRGMGMIQVDVTEVKDDMSPVAEVASGVEIKPRKEKSAEFLQSLDQELKNYNINYQK